MNDRHLQRLAVLLLKLRAVIVLVLLLVLFSVLTPSFLTANNFSILAKHVSISAILAIGMTYVVLTGGIDLSVGSVAGLSGIVAGLLITQGFVFAGAPHYFPISVVILISLLTGMAVGALNGLLVVRLSVPPFIATSAPFT